MLYLLSLYLQHNTQELGQLITEWQQVCQVALQDLEEHYRKLDLEGEQLNMEKLLELLNIDPKLVGYSVEDEAFIPI